MKGLGRLFDIGTGWSPVDLDTLNAATGKRVDMAHARACTFLVFCAAGAADDLVLDVQQHTAYTGGTTADLDSTAVATSTGVVEWFIKAETLLDNDESWSRQTQTEASEVTVTGATWGAMEKIIAIHVDADQLGDTYTHLSLNAAVTTANPLLSSCVYILHDLVTQRAPANMPNWLHPGAANA